MGARNINALNNDNNNPQDINDIININEEENGNQQNLIPIEEQNQIVQERAISKKILSIRLPCNLDKKTLSLEQDSISPDKFFIKFNYDSLFDLDCYINFNVSEKSDISLKNTNYKLSYSPSENFIEKGFYQKELKNGENKEFYNKEAFIDIRNYYEEKNENQNSFDICIEFVPLFPPGSPEISDNNEIVFVTLCNFERHQEENTYMIKCIKQRIKTHKIWIDLYDIFDTSMDGGLCLICCSEKRNTIFLPCKHACCCNKCGSEIKYRFKPCPICKTPKNNNMINDSKNIIENDNEEDVLIPVDNKAKEEIKINIEENDEKKNLISDKNDKKQDEIINVNNVNNNIIEEDKNDNIENNYTKFEDKDNKGE